MLAKIAQFHQCFKDEAGKRKNDATRTQRERKAECEMSEREREKCQASTVLSELLTQTCKKRREIEKHVTRAAVKV